MTAEHDRPSARAVERLATGVGDDVSDLRTQLHRALDEAERLAADGRDDLAVTVLEEQREALLTVHQRLQARVADAAVEREAERVVGGAVPAVPESAAASGPAPEPALVGSDGTSLRLLASAVAAVLGIALLLSPELDRTELTAAGAAGASDGAVLEDQSARPDEPDRDSQTTSSATPVERESRAQERRHPAALAIPDMPPGWAAEREDRDDDTSGASELVPLPVEPSLDALPHAPDGLAGDPDALAGDGDGTDGDQDAAGSTSDDDTDQEDGGAPITSGHGTSEQPEEGDEPSQNGTTETDDGTDDTATEDDAQDPDQADDGSADKSDDPGDGSPTGGDLDLDGTGQDAALDR